jgi:hypothetical protein
MDDLPKSSTLSAIVIYGLLVALVLGVCLSVTVAPSGEAKSRVLRVCTGAEPKDRPSLVPLPPCKPAVRTPAAPVGNLAR